MVRKPGDQTVLRISHQTKLQIGTELAPDGHRVGRDPRQMSPDELRAMGHEVRPVLKSIRAFCVECCGGSTDEARKCTAVGCFLWPLRMGTNPGRAPASPAQREHARTLRTKRRSQPSEAQSLNAPETEAYPATPSKGRHSRGADPFSL
jgi:hypothetical protein